MNLKKEFIEDFERRLKIATSDPYNQAVLRLAEAMYLRHGGLYPRMQCVEVAWDMGADLAKQGHSTPDIIIGLNDAAKKMAG